MFYFTVLIYHVYTENINFGIYIISTTRKMSHMNSLITLYFFCKNKFFPTQGARILLSSADFKVKIFW